MTASYSQVTQTRDLLEAANIIADSKGRLHARNHTVGYERAGVKHVADLRP
jgi:hypothetical protein